MGSAYITVACQMILVFIMYLASRDKISISSEWRFVALVALGALGSVFIHQEISPYAVEWITSLQLGSALTALSNIFFTGIIF